MTPRAAICALVAIASVASPGAQPTNLWIVSPDSETVLSGQSTFEVDARQLGTAVVEVKYFVDGVEACSSIVAPFRCTWDVGPIASARHVRAVAFRKDGSRLTAALRTKGIEISESVSVDAVVVSAQVTDYRGRFVPGLQRSDFRILEDGVPQEITSFGTHDSAVELVVALDVSESMTPLFDGLKSVVLEFLNRLRPQDGVTVAGFNTGFFVAAPRSLAPDKREAFVRRMRPWGGTALYDAMIRACDLLKQTRGRQALVVFTDGDDVSSRSSSDLARAALQAHDVVLYVIAQGRAAEDRRLQERLETLAIETGGAAFFETRPSSLREHFAAVFANLTNQYLLAYSPRRSIGDGKWREIRVELTGDRHRVRARQGYFATRPGGSGLQ